jgi:hypothetical protein
MSKEDRGRVKNPEEDGRVKNTEKYEKNQKNK